MGKIGGTPASPRKLHAEGIGQALFLIALVVTKGFPVGGHGNDLAGAIGPHRRSQPISKGSGPGQHIPKTHVAGNWPIVKKQINVAVSGQGGRRIRRRCRVDRLRFPSLRHKTPIRPSGVNLPRSHIHPVRLRIGFRGQRSAALGLGWGKNHKFNALVDEHIKGGVIHGCFR